MIHSECTSTLDLVDDEIGKSLIGIGRGVEKEGLRVTSELGIAQSTHPQSLGSTLTHHSITTDYSEALLEFITPVHTKIDDTINYLSNLHALTLSNLGDEAIWSSSMPCLLQGDASIPIADYGTSNVGMLKHVYRQGLGVRYGRIMQSIAGIHYNFSLPDSFWELYRTKFYASLAQQDQQNLQDFKSTHYFSLIRNFRRYSWLLHYLFGASPVLDESFLNGREASEHGLQKLADRTWGLPYGTSLRMSDLGYQNSAQEDLRISYNSLDEYVSTLSAAIQKPFEKYAQAGVKRDDKYIQLNTNILQIENEYYSDIRPKRVTRSGETPVKALRDRGVEYIEVRILDINPFLNEGLSGQQIRFMDAFLLYCLFAQCPSQSDTRCSETRLNQSEVISRGRDPELTLERDGTKVKLKDAASELLEAIAKIAEVLDTAHETFDYSSAIYAQQAKVDDSSLTPSGQVMALVEQGRDFIEITSEQARAQKTHFMSLETDADFIEQMQREAISSLTRQSEMEASDEQSFAEFLAAFNNA